MKWGIFIKTVKGEKLLESSSNLYASIDRQIYFSKIHGAENIIRRKIS